MKNWVTGFCVLVVIVTTGAGRAAAGVNETGLRFYDKELKQYTEAPGIASEIDVSINGATARTKVIQYFANDTNEWQEGVYTYPMPDSSSVDKMVMVIGDRRILGFVAQKEKAKQIYEQAKKEGKATSLVEQHRTNLFRNSVANIPPHSLIAIEISYQHDVAIDGHDFSVRLPMAITPRFDQFSPRDFLTLASAEPGRAAEDVLERVRLFNFEDGNNPVSLRVTLDSGFKNGDIASPSHKINVGKGADNRVTITTKEKLLPGEQDFVLHWTPQDVSKPVSFFHSEKIDGEYFSHIVVTPPRPEVGFLKGDQKPRQVTLIIDVSGSMDGPSIRQAKAALIEAVEDLGPEDYFNVISFESNTDWLFDEPVKASGDNRKEALKWISNLEAGGGTMMMPAIQRALEEDHIEGMLRQVVFITDGAISYEGTLADFIRQNVGDARFFAVGIGAAPNEHLMRMIAMTGRGTFTFIGDIDETGKKMSSLFKKMKEPVVTDLRIVLDDKSEAETIPANMPDLLYGEAIRIAMRTSAPVDEIKLAGMKGTKSWSQKIDGRNAEQAEGVARIFARRKIDEINLADPQGFENETEAQITMLGIKHQIVTAFTSMVAVDEKILRPNYEPLATRRYNPNLPKGWQLAEFDPRQAAQDYDAMLERKKLEENQNKADQNIKMPQTATNWLMVLVSGLLMLLFSFVFYIAGYRGGHHEEAHI